MRYGTSTAVAVSSLCAWHQWRPVFVNRRACAPVSRPAIVSRHLCSRSMTDSISSIPKLDHNLIGYGLHAHGTKPAAGACPPLCVHRVSLTTTRVFSHISFALYVSVMLPIASSLHSRTRAAKTHAEVQRLYSCPKQVFRQDRRTNMSPSQRTSVDLGAM